MRLNHMGGYELYPRGKLATCPTTDVTCLEFDDDADK